MFICRLEAITSQSCKEFRTETDTYYGNVKEFKNSRETNTIAKLAKYVIILASNIARFDRFQLFTLEIYMDFSNR